MESDLAARVLWLGVSRNKALVELQQDLHSVPVQAGWHQEEREFWPRITMGRLRSKKSVTDFLSPFTNKKLGKWEIDQVTVFESRRHGNFPEYIPVVSYPLKGRLADSD